MNFSLYLYSRRGSLSSNSRYFLANFPSAPIILVRPVMADHGTCKTTTDRLEDALSRLTLHHESLPSRHSDLASKVEILLDHLNNPLQCPQHQPITPFLLRRPIKLDVLWFDDHDPLGWIFKISQFFEFYGTPEEERITVTSFYMDGPTLNWFQWSYRNGFITSWPAFL